MKISTPIMGAFALRRLELAVWLVMTMLFFGGAIARHATASKADVASVEWRVNLNTASPEEMMTLPGMTSRRARAICAAREKRGGFERIGDLAGVPGVTSGYVKRIEDLVDVGQNAGIKR